ncbi:MAG: GreA/GreB family elongation factor [Thermodesulfobacteriota bacterium]
MRNLPIVKELEEELKKVERELRFDVPKELRIAAAHGDLSENAEYDAAKERKVFLEARAAHLMERINSLSSLKISSIPVDSVGFGSRVQLEDINTGDTISYELVTPEEVDARKGKISIASPVGRAMMGKGIEDEVTVKLPTGLKEYVITGFKTLHVLLSEGEG